MGKSGKPPTWWNTLRVTNSPRSPKQMLCTGSRVHNAYSRRSFEGTSENSSRNVPAPLPEPMARYTASIAPAVSSVSACRNSKMSPLAAAAPAFICDARPRADDVTKIAPSSRTRSRVLSVDPPSDTTISQAGPCFLIDCSVLAIRDPSFSVGTTTETRMRLPVHLLHTEHRSARLDEFGCVDFDHHETEFGQKFSSFVTALR